LVNMLSQMG